MMRTSPYPFFTAALAALALLASPAGAQGNRDRDRDRDWDRDRQSVDTSFTFDRMGSVNLGLVSGEIRVTAGTTNEIRIVATVERGRLETSFSRTRVSIETRSVGGRLGRARYELTVPVGTRVSANAVSGDIEIRGTRAAVEANSVSGDMIIRDVEERLDIASVSGSVDLSGARGRILVESVSGDLRLSDLGGNLEIETVSGEIELRNSRLDGIRASSVSGDLTYDGPFSPTGTYRFNAHSGSVEFALPANAGARLELETFSGRIASDFPLTLEPGQSAGRRRRMQFTIGAGGSVISAETFSGNITIRRLAARGNQE